MLILLGIRGRNVEGPVPAAVDIPAVLESIERWSMGLVDVEDGFEDVLVSTMDCKGAADEDEAARWSAKNAEGAWGGGLYVV